MCNSYLYKYQKRKINKKDCGFLTCEMKKGVIIYNFKFFKL